jgi:septal ring factor EnvC (AmiA/AmiB activator)
MRIFIIGELSKKGQSDENLKRLEEELEKVKTDLCNAEGKKQYLQTELEKITKAKEDAESHLKAKQDVLANLGELVEAELQCSICSELFVTVSNQDKGLVFRALIQVCMFLTVSLKKIKFLKRNRILSVKTGNRSC